MTQKKKIKKTYYTRRNTAFDYFNIVLQALLALTILIPFLHLLVISVSSPSYATRSGLHLWPDTLDFSTYKRVLSSRYIWTGYRATLIRTVLGTVIQLFMTSMGAYVLSKRYFRTFWTMCIVFTMYFSGGLIPSYLLMGNLHLMNTYASMILPGLVGTYNMILIRNYFQSIPQDLEDACMIDGAGQFTTYYKIINPVHSHPRHRRPVAGGRPLEFVVRRAAVYAERGENDPSDYPAPHRARGHAAAAGYVVQQHAGRYTGGFV